MSDETETPSNERKNGAGGRPQTDIDPKDKALFEWLEGLFYSEPESSHFPELVDVRVVSGPRKERLGPYLEKFFFAPVNATGEAIKRGAGLRKPTREQLAIMTNKVLFMMQRDCDQQRQPVSYGLHAWQSSADDQPYTRFLRTLKPTGRLAQENVKRGDEADEDDEQLSIEKRHSVQVLHHNETMFTLYGTAMDNILARHEHIMERVMARNDRLEDRVEKLVDMIERALSLQEERNERLEWSKLKRHGAERAMDLGAAVLPPLINALTGKAVMPAENPEVLTLKEFFKPVDQGGKMTAEQACKAFGVYDDNGSVTAPGILSKEQSAILYGVALGQMPPDALDQLLPGGPYAVEAEQAMSLQQVFPLEQLAPIMLIIQTRMSRQKK